MSKDRQEKKKNNTFAIIHNLTFLKAMKITLENATVTGFTFELGDIVTLKSNPLLFPKHLSTNDVAIPPFMVVVEVVKEKNKKEKVKCQYFVHKQGSFTSVLFESELLINISEVMRNNRISEEEHEPVELNEEKKKFQGKLLNIMPFLTKSTDLEKKISETETKLEKAEKDMDQDEINLLQNQLEVCKKDLKFAKFLDLLFDSNPININTKSVCFNTNAFELFYKERFVTQKNQTISPIMLVKSFEMEKIERTQIQDQEGNIIRQISPYKIKCMWYNPIEAKFSEDWFIPEALFEVKEENN